jgi:glutamyl-tRNA synthetase
VTPVPVRGRFAPSPTGDVHLGTARTALLAWLAARRAGGAFVMRVEDLDAARVVPGAEARILADLRWLGIDWDEGPDVGGAYGPYRQSERLPLYREALATLEAEGRLFRCYCSRKDLAAAASAPHAGEEGPRYPGTCRDGARTPPPGRAPALRFRVEPGVVAFDDERAGRVEQDVAAAVGDFVVCRADGTPAYQLAVVVDDAAMRITQVVRGVDLLASTPRQILLYRALGLRVPSFQHVPLVVDAEGVRLAKRHASAFLAAQRDAGRRPEDVVGELAASVGMHPGGTGPISAAELLRATPAGAAG